MNKQTAFGVHESILNRFYNVGGFNKPERVGYLMKMIRNLKPSSMMEWMYWYFEHIHDFSYLYNLAIQFWQTIPDTYGIEFKEALAYVGDVMFQRTFSGYIKEANALQILRKAINPTIEESPADWDNLYFIDFYFFNAQKQLIGIQLKPESFLYGHCDQYVAIKDKMQRFCQDYNAKAFILYYRQGYDTKSISNFFINPETINLIKQTAA